MFLYGQKVFAVKLPIRISIYEKTLTEKSSVWAISMSLS